MSKPVVAVNSFSTRLLETEKDSTSTLEYTNLTSQMRKLRLREAKGLSKITMTVSGR